MANYFVAGVGRALLFKGEELFADCRTLADSSITIGVTAEDIRGGEGNVLFGQYYHDSSFSMKLTDVMFNLDYIAANTGALKEQAGNIYSHETKTADASGSIALSAAPLPVISGGTAYVWYRKASENVAMQKKAVVGSSIDGLDANTEYCLMYRKAVDGEMITINSQFIPDTLHAVLTVALYSGDSCNVESATKAGEVVIDIPRLQLSGAMDISMSATGAAQTPLEGNALASGCTGCDGKAIYATITKYIESAHWFDTAEGILVENGQVNFTVGQTGTVTPVIYAFFKNAAPKRLSEADYKLVVAAGATKIETANNAKALQLKSEATAGSEPFTVIALNGTTELELSCQAVAVVE